MRVELINTGTELVLGDTVNTNAAWLGQRLAGLGLAVARQTVVPDGAVIAEVLAEAAARADIVVVTGGLGPTNDDITREVTAQLLGLELQESAAVMEHLDAYFRQRGRTVNAATRLQAMVPEGGVVLPNRQGTAPGLYLAAGLGTGRAADCHFFLLPGPPRELKPMMEQEVEPLLCRLVPAAGTRVVRYLKTTGLGESDLVDRIQADLEARADQGLELGYCLGRGDVDVRLAGPAEVVEEAAEWVRQRLGPLVFSEDRRVLEEVVVDLLRERGQWVATAESCTGGLIACRITDVSGASAVLGRGWVTYSNEAKTAELGVPADLISLHGAVSAEVVQAMAEGARQMADADHGLAVTGIAGPTGGTEEKPVGTVFVGLASRGEPVCSAKLFFPGARDRFKLLTSQAALDMLRRRLLGVSLNEI